ncbi:hypothetical protein AWB81_02387 [Caballeronia arationis]|jgi:hypothetical protein|uniref:Uncharacterized protein n=1 Tax=Caballeronia arationis TaxID=1777142 RepID=A0A7Z7N6F0_9BURK|nr:hypothetical protein AWB81_02387 [Caballeronia arationis]SOE88720.1 hypothetical protein SAMN05446927_7342 [Caballeronia arationis]
MTEPGKPLFPLKACVIDFVGAVFALIAHAPACVFSRP